MIQINAPKYPIKIDIKTIINEFVQPYTNILYDKYNIKLENNFPPIIKFDEENDTVDVLACNTMGVMIEFFIIPITETLSHLRTEIAQKTFIKILLMHELLHSVDKQTNHPEITDNSKYESYVTYHAIDILHSKNLINYNDLFSEYRRSKFYGTSVKTKEHLYLINLMYPLSIISDNTIIKGTFYNGEQFG